jgi:hypothetical protein
MLKVVTCVTSGCAIVNGRDKGVTKLLFDDSPEAHGHGEILGSDMISEIAQVMEIAICGLPTHRQARFCGGLSMPGMSPLPVRVRGDR